MAQWKVLITVYNLEVVGSNQIIDITKLEINRQTRIYTTKLAWFHECLDHSNERQYSLSLKISNNCLYYHCYFLFYHQ